MAGAARGDIVINEVCAVNGTNFSNGDSFPDWIEIYNSSAANADIGGYLLREIQDTGSSTTSNNFVFPAGTTLAAFERRILWCDNATNIPGTHVKFGLPSVGTSLTLIAPPNTILDRVSFGFQVKDLSIGRVPDGPGGVWQLNRPTPQAPNEAYALVDSFTFIKINEWAATNAPPGNTNDWLEIYNTSTNPVTMTGMIISDQVLDEFIPMVPGTYHAMTNLSFIAGNDFIRFWCDKKRKPTDHLNLFLGSTDGDTVRIYYPDRTTWFEEISFPGNTNIPGYWDGHSSYGRIPDGGPLYPERFIKPTPEDSNFQLMTNVLVNEVLSHTDLPFEDAIELYNTTEDWVIIGDWWISNQKNTPKKFRVPFGIQIPPKGYYVFYEYAGVTNVVPKQGFNTSRETDPLDFTLNSAHGDEVWLFSGNAYGELTGLRGSMKFDSAANGVSFGPVYNSVGDKEIVPLTRHTFGADNPANVGEFRGGTGAANGGPQFGPIVISEIYYHPPDLIVRGTNFDNDFDEFVELYNTATTNVLMYDPVIYRDENNRVYSEGRTNTWHLRGVVDEDFPTNFVMRPGQFVLFVNFSPTNTIQLNDFRNRLNVPESVAIFGPYGSKLDNSSGDIEIKRPDPTQGPQHPDFGYVPYILIDSVKYHDSSPWTSRPDGATNEINGTSVYPHIGYSLQRVTVEAYGDDPINWTSAVPSPGRQPVQIRDISRSGNSVTLHFQGWAGSGYTVQAYSALDSANWTRVTDLAPQPTSGLRTVVDNNVSANATRFYKIATPIQ